MSRYIDAEVLKETFNSSINTGHESFDLSAICECIDFEPDTDVEPVRHAHWIVHDDIPFVWCSGCESLIFADKERLNDKVHYCPHCGAKMDESVKQ